MTRQNLTVGDTVQLTLPYSEVCMYMRVAGKSFPVRVLADGAQLLRDDGRPYTAPITHGEAGIYADAAGLYTHTE